jgi:hypothetical protein
MGSLELPQALGSLKESQEQPGLAFFKGYQGGPGGQGDRRKGYQGGPGGQGDRKSQEQPGLASFQGYPGRPRRIGESDLLLR